jgi:hypothetical protein
VTSYLAIRSGELDVLSHDVATVTGHPPMSIRTFLSRQAAFGD